MQKKKVFLASVLNSPDRHNVFTSLPSIFWQPENEDYGGRTIEDICREMIRNSRVFIAVLDHRGGRALAFSGVDTPVTVLEIELVQALLQHMPIHIFLLPSFQKSNRLWGLISLVEQWNVATVHHVGDSTNSTCNTEEMREKIRRIAQPRLPVPLVDLTHRIKSHFVRYRKMKVEFLNLNFSSFADPFETTKTAKLIKLAGEKGDHALKLTMTWTAIRQLCSMPYNSNQSREVLELWQQALREWVQSAGWYGLHDTSPLSLLAALNSQIHIKSKLEFIPRVGTIENSVLGSPGGRASAIYSLGRKSWLPKQRIQLFNLALSEVQATISSEPPNPENPLAVRGSIYRQLLNFSSAIKDHSHVVSIRRERRRGDRLIGEALSELGWTYLWALRPFKAKTLLANGVVLMRQEGVENPSNAGFYVRALRKYALVQKLTLDFSGAKLTNEERKRVGEKFLVRDQMRNRT